MDKSRGKAHKTLPTRPVPHTGSFFESIISTNIIIPFCILAVFYIALNASFKQMDSHSRYTSVQGYFSQDDLETDWKTFDWTQKFGLKQENWSDFGDKVNTLNKEAPKNVKYKVIFFGRHGQGYHNVAEEFYGTKAWDCYYSMLPGNETMSWTDAHLTSVGKDQARLASKVWAKQLQDGISPPQSYYSSPLTRCMQTAYLTFSPLFSGQSAENPAFLFVPKIKEMIRETIGVHTCDMRSSRTAIEGFLADGRMKFQFEAGFKEKDELWDRELRELEPGEDKRSLAAIDDIFGNDDATFISISAHSGIISSMLRVLGHRPFGLITGAVIPILVKAEVVKGKRPAIIGDTYQRIVPCKEPPTPLSLV